MSGLPVKRQWKSFYSRDRKNIFYTFRIFILYLYTMRKTCVLREDGNKSQPRSAMFKQISKSSILIFKSYCKGKRFLESTTILLEGTDRGTCNENMLRFTGIVIPGKSISGLNITSSTRCKYKGIFGIKF